MPIDADTHQRCVRFWAWFVAHSADWKELEKAAHPTLHPFWDAALTELKRVHAGLAFELSDPEQGRRDFVITAQGDRRLFNLVETLVELAPALPRWRFLALKPPMGFDFVHHYEDRVYDPQRMWFLPLADPAQPTRLGLRVGIPSLGDLDGDAAAFATTIILETALGERAAANDVHYVEVARLPNDPASEGFIELPELAEYIAWKKRSMQRDECDERDERDGEERSGKA